ncbi:ATP-binding protein, partial [Streptomyces sp. 8N706]|uniref:ATP-binding protein n=1 Tax=Streptomyces sp. 8N706 TaxID=3457416 RepID=UPI003FD5A412
VQEQAALADFDQTAPEDAVDRYANTVNGTEVSTAERYLVRLTDQPQLSSQDLALDKDRVDAALSGRIDRMRAAESALTNAEATRLAEVRDNDVTTLELRIALVVVCLLLAVGISMSAARSLTRPLAVLRLGARRVAADPVAEEPVRYTGRNDEFADVVKAVNELREAAVRLHGRTEQLGDDRTRLVAERKRLADQREELLRAQRELTANLAGIEDRVHGSHVNLALRTLTLVERQLGVIEGLEDSEQEPERLDTLFKLDHLATRMRRHSENLLVLAGAEHGTGHTGPVPLLDVMRAAISEIERYERVEIQALPPHARIAGFAADAISHLVAELLENATAFSPPDASVELSGWLLESGEVMLSVQDEGIGMTTERMEELNALLADPHPKEGTPTPDEGSALGLGLYVVGRLAARHGVRVQLREQKQGGIAAVVVLPKSILPTRPAPTGAGGAPSPGKGTAPAVNLPGSVAEANSNALPRRAPATLDSQFPPGPAVTPEPAAPAQEPATGEQEPRVPAQEPSLPPQEQGLPAQEPVLAPQEQDLPDQEPVLPVQDTAAPAAGATDPAADFDDVPPPGYGSAAEPESASHAAAQASPGPDPLGSQPAPAQDPWAPRSPQTEQLPQSSPEPQEQRQVPQVQPNHPAAPEPAPLALTSDDPLVAAAERAVAEAEAGSGRFPEPDGDPVDGGNRPTAPGGQPPFTPDASGPYAIGPDEHARATDAPAGRVDQPTQPLRLPRQAEDSPAPDTADAARAAEHPHHPSGGPDTGRHAGLAQVPGQDTGLPGREEPKAPTWERVPDSGTAGVLGDGPVRETAERAGQAERPEEERSDGTAPPCERVTDKGLPKRTPKTVAPTGPKRERTGSVDADALRRRLGGFQQGSRNGRRDAEAEIVERTGQHQTGALDEGGTVEEARG